MAKKKEKQEKQQEEQVKQEAQIEPQPEAQEEQAEKQKAYGLVTNSEYLTGPDGKMLGKPLPRLRNKVAIVGFAPSSMHDVRFLFDRKKEFEFWAINQLYMAFPAYTQYVTRWFQFHHRQDYEQNIGRDHSHHQWMASQRDFPIYMQVKEDDIPASIPFPKDIILRWAQDEFRLRGWRYFTNSISWQIALAIMEGFEEIHVYGVDMAQDQEYSEQRPSCEYWLGIAEGRGIKVVLPSKSDLLMATWLYPFEDESAFRTKCETRRKELRDRVNGLFMNEQGLHDERMQLLGALSNMNYVERAWGSARVEMEYPVGMNPYANPKQQDLLK